MIKLIVRAINFMRDRRTVRPGGKTMIGIVHDTAESRHLALIESVAQGRVPTKDIEEVSSSWQRCASELLINPKSQAGPHVATESELRIFREPLTRAIISAQEEIDRLFAIVRQEGYVVLLCNSEGVAIHHRGHEARDEELKDRGIGLGGGFGSGVSSRSKSRAQMGSARASLNRGRFWSIANNIFGHATSISVVRRRLSLTAKAKSRWLLIAVLSSGARHS